MPACKVCGSWFAKVKPHEELCDKCECALCRLSGYVAQVRHGMFTHGIQQEVDEQPTIDAAPVIRCRECRKWQKQDTTWLCRGFGYCTECMMGCHADNYCSYGYRKEGAD